MRSLLSCWKIGIVTVAVLMAATSGHAAPTVTVLTDKASYRAGETIEVSLGGENHDEPLSVDVYVGLVGRDGALYTLGEAGWGAYLEPWMADVLVPNPFYMAPVAFQWFDIPCAMPPIGEAGEYSFAAGLTQPGTLDFVAEISFAPFTINPPEIHVYVSAETGSDANDGSLDSPFKTITHALASVSGSEARPVTIHVGAGTYSKSTNGEVFPLCMKSWISLSGEYRDTTILDAEHDAPHVIYCDGVDMTRIEGLTITGGVAQGGFPDHVGGGIYCRGHSDIRVSNSAIVGNTARNEGGGIFSTDCEVRIEHSIISDNSAGTCGGGVSFPYTSAVIESSVISMNKATGDGGGLHIYKGTATFLDNDIVSNLSGGNGGGFCSNESSIGSVSGCIFVLNSAAADGGGISYGTYPISISGCEFTSNSASGRGGGIYCERRGREFAVNIEDGKFLDNSADLSGGGIFCNTQSLTVLSTALLGNQAGESGGGAYCPGESHIIEECAISSNSAGAKGGGVFLSSSKYARVRRNTITGNWAGENGGGLYSSGGSYGTTYISNNLISLNSTSVSGGGIACGWVLARISYCSIVGNWAGRSCGGIDTGFYTCCPIADNCILWSNNGDFAGNGRIEYSCVESDCTGFGNLHQDPLFAAGPYGEYYLDPHSPCRDAGSRSAVDAGVADSTTQADGTLDSGIVDMGYHYPVSRGERPMAHIDSISPNPATQGQGEIHFEGHGDDSEGGIAAYEWRSDLSGLLSCFECFSIDTRILPAGTHIISLEALDDDGLWSRPATSALIVVTNPLSDLFVSAELGDDSNSGAEDNPLRTVTRALQLADMASQMTPFRIHVAEGEYSPTSNGENFPLNLKSWISLVGDGAEATTLGAENSASRVIVCDCVSNSTVEGFTITGGSTVGQGVDESGGGIYCSETDLLLIKDNTITGNTADSGAGIMCVDSFPRIENNRISGNDGGRNAGIVCSGGGPTIVDNIVMNNAGVGISSGQSYVMIKNNIIIQNRDGGIAISRSGTIRSNTIVSNGGFAISGYASEFDVIDCVIQGLVTGYPSGGVNYCCLSEAEIAPEGEGNLYMDPVFVSGPLGGYYLDPNSPCINAGSMSASEAGLSDRTTQANGTPDTGTLDMGYHYSIPNVQPPDAHIDSISPNPAVQEQDVVEFRGHGTGIDGTIEGHEWSSNFDGHLGAASEVYLDASDLSVGTHVISYRVRDNHGRWSAPDTAELSVEPNKRTDVFVDGVLGDDSNIGSEDAPWLTLTHAIASLNRTRVNPVTINVAEGTYASTTNGEVFPLRAKSWISLKGEDPQTTILDAESSGPCVIYCSYVSSLTIEGFTIAGGCGGVDWKSHSKVNGGFNDGGQSLTQGDEMKPSHMSADGALGGAIRCIDSSPTFLSNVIKHNRALDCGGAIYCGGGSPAIIANVVSDNWIERTGGSGGAIYCAGCSPIIEGNIIRENWLNDGYGGGVYLSNSSAMICNNLISSNRAEGQYGFGGAIYCDYYCWPEITNNTIVANTALGGCGGICCYGYNSLPIISDCVLWGNRSDLYGCSATYCCIENPDTGEGNIHDDPMFVTGPFGEFYLHPDSPCIDRGSQSAEEAGLADRTTQADGTPDTGTVDMGYHYPIEPAKQ